MTLKKFFVTTIILFIFFSGTLLLVNSFEFKNFNKNIKLSQQQYDAFETKILGDNNDNCTDPIMLNIMYYDGNQSLLEKAFLNKYGYAYDDTGTQINWDQVDNLKHVLNGNNDGESTYGRHWNGWQIIFKPLLNFFTHDVILNIFFVIGILLWIAVFYLAWKKINFQTLVACFIFFLSSRGWAFATSFQYLTIWLPTLIGCIIVLYCIDKKDFKSEYFFYILGSIVTFLNFLNFTLISLVFPLIILLTYKFYKGNDTNYRDNINYIIKNSIYWLLGYFGFWILKWLLGALLFGSSFVNDALLSANQRLGIISNFKYLDVVYLNVHEFFSFKLNIFITIVLLIFLIIVFRKNIKVKLKISLPFILLSLFPFIWLLVLKNHSAIHFWMVYHIISLICPCVASLIMFLSTKKYDNLSIEKLNINDYAFIIIIILFFVLHEFSIIYSVILIGILVYPKFNKKLKQYTLVIFIYSLFIIIMGVMSVNNFSKEQHFENIYNDIYNKAKLYGTYYKRSHKVYKNQKINLRDLVSNYDRNSVFLLQCRGYVIFDGNSINPYINCGNLIVTDGYES